MFPASTSSESHMYDDSAKPVPALTVKKKDGSPYARFPDVEAEIGEIWRLPPSDWVHRINTLKSETLACLICNSGLKDDHVVGLLVEEANARAVRISEAFVKRCDDVLKEEIAMDVEGRIFNLLWSDRNCTQAEYLQIAFADKVRDLTKNAIEHHKKSVMGERDQLDVWTDADEGKGAFAVVELRNDLIDLRRDQEGLLILLEDEKGLDDLIQTIHAAVKDPLDFQALYLFHAEDMPLREIATRFGTHIREIRYRKDKAMHQIRVALGLETEEKREALRKRRLERQAERKRVSAQPKVFRNIRPDSQPASISI